MTDETNCISNHPYPQSDLEAMKAGSHYAEWIFSHFKPWLKGTVCEVGAGTGNNLKYICDCNPNLIYLIEPDLDLYADLLKTTEDDHSIVTVNNTLEGFAKENESVRFDSVLYINVLEHIEDDISELNSIYSRLNPGGVALIFVPALNWLFSAYDRKVGHWRRYALHEMRAKIERTGFQIQTLRYFDFIGAWAWFFMCRLFHMELNSQRVGLYDRIGVPMSSRIERLLPPAIGKNLLVVAQK